MPNIKSAKKRVIVSAEKALRNKMFKSAYKTAIRKYETAIAAGDKESAATLYTAVVKKVDQAAAKGIIHKNAAARKKSQFTLMLNTLNA